MGGKHVEQRYQNVFHFPKIDLGTKYDKVFDKEFKFYTEVFFREMLAMERKRSKRSEKPILLVKLNIEKVLGSLQRKDIVKQISSVLAGSHREIDIMGWHSHGRIIGIIYIGINESGKECIIEKIRSNLDLAFCLGDAKKIEMTCEVLPVDWYDSKMHSVASLGS